jgi:hypothetical protein
VIILNALNHHSLQLPGTIVTNTIGNLFKPLLNQIPTGRKPNRARFNPATSERMKTVSVLRQSDRLSRISKHVKLKLWIALHELIRRQRMTALHALILKPWITVTTVIAH